ncbi:MAG: hypothetical protein ACO1N0_07605 [Fluviicola sp.]
MKPFLICILFSSFSVAAFSQNLPQSFWKKLNVTPESYKQTFDFILKLDSLGYVSGYVKLENVKNGDRESVKTGFEALSDSTYSIRIKNKAYLLNTKNGKVVDLKAGEMVYQNSWIRIRKSQQAAMQGKDSLGTFTAHFGGFRNDIPSRFDYDPVFIEPDKTIEYEIRCTPTANDYDSTWIDRDTTSIIKKYHHGKMISERIERRGFLNYPQITEFHYSYSGDTIISTLVHFEDGYGEIHSSGDYVKAIPAKLSKTVCLQEPGKIHLYKYFQGENDKSVYITDTQWNFGENDGLFYKEEHRENAYYSGVPRNSLEKQQFTFTAKKR